MIDLIKDLKEISIKCDSFSKCDNCPMFLTGVSNDINTRCYLRLLMYKLSDSSPDNWVAELEELEEL